MKFDRGTFDSRRRRGGLIIEAVIATALLATAMVALGKLASNAAAVNEQANHRLAATLAAENAIQRLQDLSYEALESESASVAEAINADSGCDVAIRIETFNTAQRDALHIVVRVDHDNRGPVTLHDWRFMPANEEGATSANESADSDGGDD